VNASSGATDVLEIRQSPIAMLGLLLGTVVLTLGGIAIALHWIPVRAGSFKEFVGGYASAGFFGLCTAVILWRLATVRGPVITITPEGIRDVRIAAEFIPWHTIKSVSTWQHRGFRCMVLAVDPAVENRLSLRLPRATKWLRGPNRLLGVDGLCVDATGLTIDYDTLFRTCVSYHQASR
jgi:hypothetical protein